MNYGYRCFPGNTLVALPSGTAPIKNCNIGTVVKSVELESGVEKPGTVVGYQIWGDDPILLRIHFESGDQLVASPTQRLWTGEFWELSGKIEVGLRINGLVVAAIDRFDRTEPLYTLVVEPTNNYVICTKDGNEIVCHDNSSDLGA